ncbi:MAG: hypothetical protein ACE5D2_04035 [Fidelibacterota bacterium]
MMPIKRYLLVLSLLVFGTQSLYANYAFYRQVTNTCKYYRVEVNQSDMLLTKTADGQYSFTISLRSMRNNFEMVMLVGFISVGQAILHQRKLAASNSGYAPVVPENTEVTVKVPISREDMVITASARADMIVDLAEGKIDTAEFMRRIKDSIQTL